MAGFVSGGPINTNGTTPVVAVAAPATGKQRHVLAIHFENRDSVDHTVTLQKDIGGTNVPIYPPRSVLAGKFAQLIPEGGIVLDADNISLEIVLGAAHTGTAPRFDPAVFEVP